MMIKTEIDSPGRHYLAVEHIVEIWTDRPAGSGKWTVLVRLAGATYSRHPYVTFSEHTTEDEAEDAAEKLAERVNGHDSGNL